MTNEHKQNMALALAQGECVELDIVASQWGFDHIPAPLVTFSNNEHIMSSMTIAPRELVTITDNGFAGVVGIGGRCHWVIVSWNSVRNIRTAPPKPESNIIYVNFETKERVL